MIIVVTKDGVLPLKFYEGQGYLVVSANVVKVQAPQAYRAKKLGSPRQAIESWLDK